MPVMSFAGQKRKHKTLTIKEKCDILDRLNRNESMVSLASEYGVGRSTIYDIKKRHEKITKFASTTNCGPGRRQTLKKARHSEVEDALYIWYFQERKKRTPVTGSMLTMKAKYFYKEIVKKDDFIASKGWLERFKNRYGIRLMSIAGEKISNDANNIKLFKIRFLQKVKDLGLNPSQVYSAGEAGLFWRVPGQTITKERVTILPCANAAGTHALKLVVVGKSNKIYAFKNDDLPVHYYEQKSAWITKDLFKKWFDECFVPEVKKWLKDHNLPQKALLILDNTPGHPSEEELTTEDKSITAMLLPTNCTDQIQPMDQHVIQLFKQDYKKNLLLRAISKDRTKEKTLKELEMIDLVFTLCQSWNALPSSTITMSWKKLWPDIAAPSSNNLQTSIPLEVIERVVGETKLNREELEIWWRGMDKEEDIFHEMSDEEIIKEVCSCTKINLEVVNKVIADDSQVTIEEEYKVEVIANKSQITIKQEDDEELFAETSQVTIKQEDDGEIITNTLQVIIKEEDDNEAISNTPQVIPKRKDDDEINAKTSQGLIEQEHDVKVISNTLHELIKQRDDDVFEKTPKVSAQDAVKAFEMSLQWAEENGASFNELSVLQRLRDKALVLCYNNVKQEKS